MRMASSGIGAADEFALPLAEALLAIREPERDAFIATLTDQEIRLIEAGLDCIAPPGVGA